MNHLIDNNLIQDLIRQVQIFDTYGVFQRLFFNQKMMGSPEGVLRYLGWVHLYTASGIHLYALLIAFEAFLKRLPLFMSSHRLAPHIPIIKIIMRAILLAVFLFLWVLQEFRFGFLRPLMMFFLRQGARELGLRWSLLAPLALTFLFDLIFSDGAGRLHYFLAVGGGILAVECFCGAKERNSESMISTGMAVHIALAVGSWVLIAMVDLFHDHHVSLFTPFWSLITLPLFCGVVYPVMTALIFLKCCGLVVPLEAVGKLGTAVLGFFVEVIDRFEFTFMVIDHNSVFLGLFFGTLFTLVFFILKKRNNQALLVFAMFLISIILRMSGVLNSKQISLTQLDVGQGDGLLVQKQNRIEMIDVGSAQKTNEEKWLGLLSRHNVTHIDGILLSHLDEDHQGSIQYLSSIVKINCIEAHDSLWSSEKGQKLISKFSKNQSTIKFLSQGCIQLFDHTWLGSGKHGKGNELMAGSLIELSPSTVYLAAGDADEFQEQEYYDHFKEKINQYPHRIWKVSHHGSRFSSSLEVLQKIKPEVAWLSVGRYNRYRHPTPQTLFRFSELGVPVHRTDLEGEIQYE